LNLKYQGGIRVVYCSNSLMEY